MGPLHFTGVLQDLLQCSTGLQARFVMDGSPCRLRLSSKWGGGAMTILEHGLKDILLYCKSLSNRAQL